MSEPWKKRTDSERDFDSRVTFIIFCEDESSEPIYFRYFETEEIKVNVIENQKSKSDNVNSAIRHCQDHDFLDKKNHESKIKMDDFFVWCVYDRDKEENEDRIKAGDTSFDESIRTAHARGINVAWSNDSFELWILLHFEDVELREEAKHRSYYYDRLTEVFKRIEEPNEELQKALSHEKFYYKSSLKSRKKFINVVRPEVVKNTRVAIERAEILEAQFDQQLSPHLKAPCTTVHHLVKQLLHYGQKELVETT